MIGEKLNKLSARLLLYVVLISSSFTLLVTAFQLYMDYRRDMKTVHESVAFIEESYLPALATSAYDLDERQMLFQLEGARKLPDIIYLEITEKDRTGTQVLARSGDPTASRDIWRSFPLEYPDAPAGTPQRATLHVGASFAGVYDRLWDKALLLLASNAVKTFFASLCIFAIIQFMVTRHLRKMADFAEKLNLEQLDRPLELARGDAPPNDELNLVVNAFNEMRERMLEDVEERDKAEQKLRESEENLRITLDSIGDAVITTDRDGMITGLNPVASQLTGWSADEARGKGLREVFKVVDPDTLQPVPSPVDTVVESGKIVGLSNHTVLLTRSGDQRQIADSGAPIRDRNGRIVGVVLVFRDVTEQHILEEQLAHSRRMDSVGQLAGGIAHDFNNMLGGIIGAAEILHEQISEEDRVMTQLILDTSERAAELTGKLLSFSRKGKLLSRPLDIHQVLQDTITLLQPGINRKVQLETQFNAVTTQLIGDPNQLQNAFMNLGLNARDAMPDGGKLIVATENTKLDKAYCETSSFPLTPGAYVNVTVEDTGTGMDSATMKRIFEPFFTTKEIGKGTGLGLAAVYGTIRDHHGAIHVYSELGRGTKFHVYLPISEELVSDDDTPVNDIRRGSGCVLVVDDEEVIRTTARKILVELGYDVLMAADGEEALEVYQEHRDRITVVLLDIVMPKMGGEACFRAIRLMDQDAKVILTSGFADDTVVNKLWAEGIGGFLKKPYRLTDLSQTLSSVHQEA